MKSSFFYVFRAYFSKLLFEPACYADMTSWFSKPVIADRVVAADFVFTLAGSSGLCFSSFSDFLDEWFFE